MLVSGLGAFVWAKSQAEAEADSRMYAVFLGKKQAVPEQKGVENLLPFSNCCVLGDKDVACYLVESVCTH